AASLAPVLGPALYRAAGHRLTPLAFLDGLVYVALPGLVFLVVFPESAGVGNWTPLALLVLGAVGPSLAERLFHRFAEGTHRLAVFLGVSGLALHALLEGAALGPAVLGTEGGSPFVLAVVLHRLPVGLAVWWLLRPSYGPRVALGAIAALIACTLAGYGAGEELTTALSGRAAGLFQAFVAGTLLHVVFHKAPTPAQMSGIEGRPAPARAEGWGALAGLALLAAVAWPEMASGEHGGHAVAEFARRFAGLTLESAPALLLAYIAAGLLSEFMPASSIAWMARGGSLSSAARGMTVGLPFPVCSCGVVPLYRTLVTRGAPAAAAMAFLVATPELGFDAVFLSFPLLGGPMTLIRVGAAALTALLVGWIVGGWLARRGGDHRAVDEAPPAEAPTGPLGTRLARAAGAGFGDVVDHTAPWILLGLFVAAAAAPYLEGGWLGAIPSGLDVAVFALLGLPTYVCASSATPLVAALMAGGLSPGAALAFLITGPATNATTFGVLAQLHGRRAALVFSLTIIGLSVGLGLLVNGVWGHLTTPSLDALAEEPGSVVERISA
ncbi:MAG: hypothetical protein D6701_10560, partial [Gemmatimonadetes bacterium]